MNISWINIGVSVLGLMAGVSITLYETAKLSPKVLYHFASHQQRLRLPEALHLCQGIDFKKQ